MARIKLVIEELEVDKLHRLNTQNNSGSQFDELYGTVKADIEKTTEGEEVDNEAVVDQNPPEAPTDVETSNNPSDNDSDATQAVLESFMQYHTECFKVSKKLDTQLAIEEHSPAVDFIYDKSLAGLRYLKDKGVEYGPVILKHVYKGVIYALEKTVKALVQGSIAIHDYIKNRILSFRNFQEQISKARETIKLLEEKKDLTEDAGFFSDQKVIDQLKIGSNLDFNATAKEALVFYKSFFSTYSSNVRSNVAGTKRVIDLVINEKIEKPNNLIKENYSFSGSVQKEVSGYTPDSKYITSYVYKNILPGDVCFISFLPNKNLSLYENVVESLDNSKMFFGVYKESLYPADKVKIMSLTELTELLDTLDEICATAIKLETVFTDCVDIRDSVESSLTGYMKFLFTAQNKLSLKDSMSDFIFHKVGFIDKTYIAGAMHVNDYIVRILSHSLGYVKEAIKIYS